MGTSLDLSAQMPGHVRETLGKSNNDSTYLLFFFKSLTLQPCISSLHPSRQFSFPHQCRQSSWAIKPRGHVHSNACPYLKKTSPSLPLLMEGEITFPNIVGIREMKTPYCQKTWRDMPQSHGRGFGQVSTGVPCRSGTGQRVAITGASPFRVVVGLWLIFTNMWWRICIVQAVVWEWHKQNTLRCSEESIISWLCIQFPVERTIAMVEPCPRKFICWCPKSPVP